jgi:hypothetical protein
MFKKILLIALIGIFVSTLKAQTTDITFQGSLRDGASLASGNYDFEFRLFDSPSGGTPIGSAIVRNGVAVANGVFAVNLDFGSVFPGGDRFLEIGVRTAGAGAFTTLAPRQKVSSAPYSIKSLSSSTADTAANATNAQSAVTFSGTLNGDVTGTQSATTVARLQSRVVANTAPLDGQVLKFNAAANQWRPDTDVIGTGGGGGTITGVTAGTGLTGGGATGNVTLAVQNGGIGTTQLADGSVTTLKIADGAVTDAKIFSVSGAKVSGTVAAANNAGTATNALNLGAIPASQYLQLNGNGSALTNLNASNVTSGTLNNARLGQIPTANIADGAVTAAKVAAGEVVKSVNNLKDNVTLAAGTNITITPAGNTLTIASTGGSVNAVLNQTTQQAGANFNITGTGTAGVLNAANQFNLNGSRILGVSGVSNTFGGVNAGANASNLAENNTFFGRSAGQTMVTAGGNSFFGSEAGQSTTAGGNSFFGGQAGKANTSGQDNAFFGLSAGTANTSGDDNSFFGRSAGTATTSGSSNSYFGRSAGSSNSSGINGSFFGFEAGKSTTGNNNSFFGFQAGLSTTTGTNNSFFGVLAGTANTTGIENSYFGRSAGDSNSTGALNSFFGRSAGAGNTSGSLNTFIGHNSGTSNTTGDRNTIIGAGANVSSSNLDYATAIGAEATVSASNRIVLGRANNQDDVHIPGSLVVEGSIETGLFNGGGSNFVCFIGALPDIGLATCGSSLRYKTDIQSWTRGLDLLKLLKPVSYRWKRDSGSDLGFIAEEIAEVEPLLATTNAKGEIEGVKYDRLSVVFVNAFREQQKQIEEQAKSIDALRRYICAKDKNAPFCE